MKKRSKQLSGKEWVVSSTRSFLCSKELTATEYRVYMIIWSHADLKTGIAYPGIRTLTEECNLQNKTVLYAIGSLEEKGLLTVIRRNRPNSKARAVNLYKCNVDPGTWQSEDFEQLAETAKENSIEKALQILEEFGADMTEEQRKRAYECVQR